MLFRILNQIFLNHYLLTASHHSLHFSSHSYILLNFFFEFLDLLVGNLLFDCDLELELVNEIFGHVQVVFHILRLLITVCNFLFFLKLSYDLIKLIFEQLHRDLAAHHLGNFSQNSIYLLFWILGVVDLQNLEFNLFCGHIYF